MHAKLSNSQEFLTLKPRHLNERIIELHDIAPKEFWGAQDAHLETIKLLKKDLASTNLKPVLTD